MAFQPTEFKSARAMLRDPVMDAMYRVVWDVKQAYLRSIAAPGKSCMKDGLEYILIYDHYVVSDGKGPLQGFDWLDWIEGSEW